MSRRAGTLTAWAEGALLGAVVSGMVGLVAVGRAGGGAGLWLTVAGLASLALGPVVGAIRALRPWPRVAWSLPVGVVLAFPVLVLLGRVLKATTHHRPLGAATFAVLAGAIFLGAVALAGRLVVMSSAAEATRARILARAALALMAGLAALAALGLIAPWLRPSAERGDLRVPFVEVACAVALSSAAVLVQLPPSIARAARIAGPVLWAALVVGGLFASRA